MCGALSPHWSVFIIAPLVVLRQQWFPLWLQSHVWAVVSCCCKHKVTNKRTTADHSPIHGFEAKPTYMASKWSAVVARTKRTTAVVLVLERV